MKRIRVTGRCLCAVLFLGVAALWVRSYFASDLYSWKGYWSPTPAPPAKGVVASANPGIAGLSELLVERTVPVRIPLNHVVTTATGRLLAYRQSPFA